jgi:hypothetical protein
MRKESRDSSRIVHRNVEAHDCAIAEPHERGTPQMEAVHYTDDVLREEVVAERLRRARASALTARVDDNRSISIPNEVRNEKSPIVRRVFSTL